MMVDPAYYETCRREVAPFLPEACARVLEVGCGTGDTLAWLKANGHCQWVAGVEIVPEVARAAAPKLDRLYNLDIEVEALDIPPGSLDAILCLDVLEHLRDPWAAVRRLVLLLRPGGVMIASVPNLRNRQVLRDLLWRGRFEYRDSGILDRTHLRFFTQGSAEELLRQAGLAVELLALLGAEKVRRRWTWKWLLNHLVGGRLEVFYATQFLLRGRVP